MTTYIKNYGVTQSYIQQKNKKSMNELKWIADYDGNDAHLHIDMLADGKKEQMNLTLNNEDLMQLLNKDTDHQPIDHRLWNDFLQHMHSRRNKTRRIKKARRKSSRTKRYSPMKSASRSFKI